MSKKISFLILNYNGIDIMEKCLGSIVKEAAECSSKCDVHVIDNVSNDGSVEWLNINYPSVFVHDAVSNDFLFSYNKILSELDCDLVFLYNNDVAVRSGFIDPLLQYFNNENTFMVASKNYYPLDEGKVSRPNRLKLKDGILRWVTTGEADDKAQIITSFNALFDRKKVVDLGAFDRRYYPFTWEDFDLCYQAYIKGYKSYYEPDSVIEHYHGYTITRESKKLGSAFPSRRIISKRNGFLFFWKNVRGIKPWGYHLIMVPLLLIKNIFYDRSYIVAFFAAVKKQWEVFNGKY